MLCTYCDNRVPDDLPFCPICGFRLKLEASLDPAAAKAAEIGERGGSPGLLWCVALSLLALALLSATIGLGILGARDGLQLRRSKDREVGMEYYRRGLVHLEEGNYLLALAEFEEAASLAPDSDEVQERLDLVRGMIEGRSVPTSVALGEALVWLYAEAQSLYADEQWEDVILRLEELRRLDSNYQRQEVEALLFDAHSQRAVTLMETGELEEALAHLDDALGIRPADQSVSDQRLWLSTYLAGLTQWGIDWVRVVGTFRELYDSNPDFLDVDQRLHDAYLNVGDQYLEEGAWCVAEQQYSAASQVMATQASIAKLDDARELCAQAIAAATPSVSPTIVPTQTVSATVVPAQAVSPTATVPVSEAVRGYVGELLGYVEVDATEMIIRVHVLSAQGEDMAGTEVQISAYDWSGKPKTTDTDGYCEFAGLTQELEFTVTLTELPSTPFLVHARWGTEAQVSFVER